MSRTMPLIILSMVLALGLAGCSLVPKPDATTTLLLPIDPPPTAQAWPADLSPGRVQASAALATDQVLVVDGARLMQAPGLRWAATPAALIGESLQRWRALGLGKQVSTVSTASLELTVDDFSWHAAKAEASVAVHGQLRCAGGAVLALPAAVANESLPSVQDADQVAAAFAAASATALADLIEAAAAAHCPP